MVPGDNNKGIKLTAKMSSFVDHFMVTGNATEAVKASLYKCKDPRRQAIELMDHPLVVAEISHRLAERTKKLEVKADYLLSKLMTIIEETQQDNPNACLKAIELAGKSIALWRERQEISGPDGEAIRHEQNIKESVADFTSRISSLAKRTGTDNVVSFPNGGGAS